MLRRDRWRGHALALWRSPRAWAFIGALCTRGAGFIASFSLSRHLGPSFLALYISTVITGAAVSGPLAQVLFNSGTLAAHAAPSVSWSQRLLQANLWLGSALLLPLCALFAVMHWPMASPLAAKLGVSQGLLAVVGFSTVAGQVYVSALTGLLNGLGAQLPSARLTAWVATLLMALSYPAVAMFGITGAWVVLLISAWLPVLLLWRLSHRYLRDTWAPAVEPAHFEVAPPLSVALRYLREGIPSSMAVMASGLVAWFCSIYLVQHYLGPQAVAVLAVANQWMTLILMPATSWGGVILKEMAHLRLSRDGVQQLPSALRRMVGRNMLVTGLLAVAVALASDWIVAGYRLQGHGLSTVLMVSGAAALLGSAYGVLERALICWDRQWQLMVFSFLGLLIQVVFTVMLVSESIIVVQLGVMLASVVSIALALWFLRGLQASSKVLPA